MKKITLPKFCAFSLAEALITLLIVCLITLASVPILTKKKRTLEQIPHGEWTCILNENGQHESWSQDSPTPVINNSYCEFVPPERAQNFIIKAVGGGGGGGAGFSELKLDALYPGESKTFDFIANNKYHIALIGAGGGGGGGNKERGGTRAHGGGSGAAVSFDFTPTYNISYSISVGNAGTGGHGDDGKHSGGDGSNGGDTSFGGMVFAGGGTGGMAIQYDGAGSACKTIKASLKCFSYGTNWQSHPECINNTGYGCGGAYKLSDPSGNLKITNVKSINGTDGTRDASGRTTGYYSAYIGEQLLQPTYSFPWPSRGESGNLASMKAGSIGMGGYGGQGKNSSGTSGMGGYAAVKSDVLVAGRAGEAAQMVLYPATTLDGKIRIVIGKGGKGGKNKYQYNNHTQTEPTDGEITKVGDLFNAPCGRAGENKVIFPSSTTASIAVGTDGPVSGIENDETPSYGGRSLNGESVSTSDAEIVTAFGGGGGGGGAMRSSDYSTASYSNVYSGDGADGGNGKVIITW